MKNPFVVGDRVRVYGLFNDLSRVFVGTVKDVSAEYPNLGFLETDLRAHHKQCRRLVKKQRRRVWIYEGAQPEGSSEGRPYRRAYMAPTHNCIEFVEVKK